MDTVSVHPDSVFVTMTRTNARRTHICDQAHTRSARSRGWDAAHALRCAARGWAYAKFRFFSRSVAVFVVGVIVAMTSQMSAQTMVEHSAETRFQLDVRVPDATLAAFLPSGWTPNIATQGPARDANLRVIFIDRLTINGPGGKPLGTGSNRLVYLEISRQEQVLEILRNVTTNPRDRVKEFTFKAGGGSYSKLFDGTERMLSSDNILWINRTVLLP